MTCFQMPSRSNSGIHQLAQAHKPSVTRGGVTQDREQPKTPIGDKVYREQHVSKGTLTLEKKRVRDDVACHDEAKQPGSSAGASRSIHAAINSNAINGRNLRQPTANLVVTDVFMFVHVNSDFCRCDENAPQNNNTESRVVRQSSTRIGRFGACRLAAPRTFHRVGQAPGPERGQNRVRLRIAAASVPSSR
jgi:hypothetical protein